MDSRPIGHLRVSAVGLGCNNFGWHLDEEASRQVVYAALDAGVTHFDTAEVYGEGRSEEILGRALGGRRDEVVIASKFGHGAGARPEAVCTAIEGSLRRLGTDRIDLYYLHKPDPETPIAETLRALAALVQAGKVREVACSNFTPTQLREAEASGADARFVALQNEYSLLHRAPEAEGGALEACRALGLAFVPYFPLKSGLLTGKYRRGSDAPEGSRLGGVEGSRFKGMGERLLTSDTLGTVEHLIAFAEARGHAVLDLALGWLLAQDPVASVIAGATRPEQVRANVAAASWALGPDDLAQLDAVLAQPA